MKKIIICLIFFPFFIYAQNIGSLDGRILDDQDQQPLEGATVIIEGTSFGVVTDEDGYFVFENIPTKSYNLTISFLGYRTKTIYNVILKSFGTPTIQVLLEESSDELEEIIYNLGFEWEYTESFIVRLGFIYDLEGGIKSPTFGAGLKFDDYGFDFGYTAGEDDDARSQTMFLSISLGL